jgi:hypothetical protein
MHQLGDEPVEDQYLDMMKTVVQALDTIFNGKAGGPDRKTGFVLLVFPYGEKGGRCNYMSNGANRADIVKLFKEQIKRFEGQTETTGRA